ncbi:MAG: hypothetical protein OEY22_08405 [Candidatus Bathyarchaeota archaeon]|nr:hypothetical protein [Candidatus Bathyarchaeota archaeon]MDH5787897.1 hypothetical protein [Candidatus Bathyarchaeota archaeon]
MSQDAEKIKRLVAFKKRLEKKVRDLESELKEFQTMLETVNSMLLEKGFKRADILKGPTTTETPQPREEVIAESAPSTPQPLTEYENIIHLKTFDDEALANLYVSENSLRVVPAEGKDFSVNTSPFTHFLLEKVFVKMQEKDNELARTGQLLPDKIFSFNIIQEGDIVREIAVKNFDADRLRELKSSIRWTLEKMYEKMKK